MNLMQLIESDDVASQLFAEAKDTECADRCNAIAEKVRVQTVLTERGLYESLGATVAETILSKLEAFSMTADPVASVIKRVLGWLKPTNGGVDFASQEVLQMCSALVAGGLLTQSECDAIDELSLKSTQYTAAQVERLRIGAN